MIQRIQTVYLLLAIILLVITNLVPLASFQLETGEITNISVLSGGHSNLTCTTLIASGLSALLCTVAIFMYRMRKKQVMVCYLAILPILLLCGYFIGYCYGSSSTDHLHFIAVKGMVLPAISIVLILLAIRRIKSDEKLVRSLDRIR